MWNSKHSADELCNHCRKMHRCIIVSYTGNSQTPKQDILVVQDNWNAKVGEDAQEDWGEVCGPSCNPETNDRGLNLLDFATYNNLVLANTLGNHKQSRRWTSQQD